MTTTCQRPHILCLYPVRPMSAFDHDHHCDEPSCWYCQDPSAPELSAPETSSEVCVMVRPSIPQPPATGSRACLVIGLSSDSHLHPAHRDAEPWVATWCAFDLA